MSGLRMGMNELSKANTNRSGAGIAEEPSDYLIQVLKESEEDRLAGWTSPAFENTEDAVAWLHDPNRKYDYQIQHDVQQTL